MASTVPCNNPGHGVKNHIVGTEAARLCALTAGDHVKNSSLAGVGTPTPATNAPANNTFGYLNGSIPLAQVSRFGTTVVFAAIKNDGFDGKYGRTERIIVGYDGPSVGQVPHHNNARAVERADIVFGRDDDGSLKLYRTPNIDGCMVEDVAGEAINAEESEDSMVQDVELGEWMRRNLK